MSLNSPAASTESFLAAFNSGDADAVANHYEPDGVFVQQDGQLVQGTDALRSTLSQFFILKPNLDVHTRKTVEVGDLAVNLGAWTLTGTDPEGNPVEMQGSGFDIMRRQADGDWKMVIDNPWGAAVLG